MGHNRSAVVAIGLVCTLLLAGCTAVDQPTTATSTTTTTDAQLDDENETADLTGDEVADRFLSNVRAVDSMSATTVRTTVEDGEQTTRERVDLLMRPGDGKVRREVVEPASKADTVRISNGSVRWRYNESSNAAYRYSVRTGGAVEQLDRMFAESNVTHEGTETIRGHEAHVLSFEPGEMAGMSDADMKIWVDSERWVPLKMVMERDSGTYVRTIELTDVTVGVQTSPSEFRPPEDAEIESSSSSDNIETYDSLDAAQAAANFSLPDPALPEKYEFQEVQSFETDNGTSFSIQYRAGDPATNGTTLTVSKYQSPDELQIRDAENETRVTVAGQDAILYDNPERPFKSIRWNCGEYGGGIYTFGSEPADQLTTLAESIGCE